jgi:hypothetical protein
MRTFTAAALLVSLAACDGGGVIDQSIEQGVRQTAIQTCIAWVPQSDIPAAAALQAERLCACATDRMLDGKSLSELSTIRFDGPEVRAAVVQCVADRQTEPSEPAW